ncbi:MAG: biotin/lipoyl-binding protein [Gemmobacter sp.]|uniref:acetyl/propionyl/methylcrotonyl-CoA carboxylase subunit alpha n=1 Tax=Gemmobacter sp. TaxID=1898957 RepID=UPI001A449B5A|nr:biotin carboxylase N-terminal domain-containing protein [Gemmobacter sp.]MBL8561765.1 biotin/lipoyl-binding protein [Gemmobacter sp.]
MFQKILIANRGEIACRIIATARRLGVATVAVHSSADAQARHVAVADEAVAIGGPAPRDSYLRGEAVIAAALATGAQAIHPGYGFLSENPDFVDAVEAAGLTFIGPSGQAIRAMGLKDAAKALMSQAGVPVVPGYHGSQQDPAFLADQATQIGYPVLIKAVAGGGGKGMRKVTRAEDFADALASAQGEAATAFGNDAVLIEKYVEKPRHIEVQVFGDGTDAVHLFERDCSLQRRHQKVIEEAPAPGMPAEMRAAMGEAAVRAARAIRYKGAGTIEFIVDASEGLRPDRFWFMEMNTRLQVEHPVTEAVTGTDLVEWQLRVASGEPLPLRQDQLALTGHAFEARLYAEDVPAGFLPATGRLAHLAFPPGCRSDTGVRSGDWVSPWYDPMIAKVIVHGPTRAAALQQLSRALEQTQVAGTVTNLAFLGALARHPGFATGDVDTGLIERDLATLVTPQAPSQAVKVAALLASVSPVTPGAALPGESVSPVTLSPVSGGQTVQPVTLPGFTLWAPLHRAIAVEREGEVTHATLILRDGAPLIRLEGAEHSAPRLPVIRTGDALHVFENGQCFSFTPVDPLAREAAAGAAGNATLSPMPGLVKAVFVTPGQAVQAGDRLAILEAMKMEHTLTAARDGVIAEILTAPGAQVEAGAALILLAEEGAA